MSRIRSEYMDPAGVRHGGMPTVHWGGANPTVYATRRQLAAEGLTPGRQPIAAQILWWGITGEGGYGTRAAYLYLRELAVPKRPATPAQLAALDKANRARRTCDTCGEVKDYVIPRSLGECVDCHREYVTYLRFTSPESEAA